MKIKQNIKRALLLVAGLLFFSSMSFAAGSAQKQPTAKNVPAITLNNGVKIPQLGLGTWQLGGDTTQAVKDAIALGYRLIDTAQRYGNEAEVWQGIKASGINRKEIFITTKVWTDAMRQGKVRESLDKSIKKLGGGYIDLVLIHWPAREHIKETWKILEEYVDRGKIKSIGVSNFQPRDIEALLKYARIKPVLNQIQIHPHHTNEANVEYDKKYGIAVESWSPLGRGQILGDKTLAELAKKYNKSVAQIILRWHMQRGLIAIPRSKERNHLAENIDIFNFELSPGDMAIISGLNKNHSVIPGADPDNFTW